MKRFNLNNLTRSWVATLAVVGLTALTPVRNATAFEANRANKQTTEILALLSAVHELTSYNGDAAVRAEHLAAWEQLWAEDATFTVNGATVFTGRDEIMGFFRNAPFFLNSWVGLSPSFRTEVQISGNTAEVYLECIFLDQTKTVRAERSLHGTIRKIKGEWRFWHMNNDPAIPLF